jgi:predicted DNA-binding protein YlxM (UPF0122 family)
MKTVDERLRDLHNTTQKLKMLETQRDNIIWELYFRGEYRLPLRAIAKEAGMSHQAVKERVDRWKEAHDLQSKKRPRKAS